MGEKFIGSRDVVLFNGAPSNGEVTPFALVEGEVSVLRLELAGGGIVSAHFEAEAGIVGGVQQVIPVLSLGPLATGSEEKVLGLGGVPVASGLRARFEVIGGTPTGVVVTVKESRSGLED